MITIEEEKKRGDCLNVRGKCTQGEKRTNKHRGLLEEVIDRGDKHIKVIAELQGTKTASSKE